MLSVSVSYGSSRFGLRSMTASGLWAKREGGKVEEEYISRYSYLSYKQ